MEYLFLRQYTSVRAMANPWIISVTSSPHHVRPSNSPSLASNTSLTNPVAAPHGNGLTVGQKRKASHLDCIAPRPSLSFPQAHAGNLRIGIDALRMFCDCNG